MDAKRTWLQIVTLVLCAALLVLGLWQNRRITELQNQLSNAQYSILDDVDALHGRMTALESQAEEGEKLVRDWELTPAGMDRKTHSLLTEVFLDLKEWRSDTEVRLTLRQGSDGNTVSLEGDGTGRFSGALPIFLEGEALFLEVRIDSGGASRREELGGWDDVAMLLPVRMSGSGYGGPAYRYGVFSVDGYTVDLTDQSGQPAAVTEPSFCLQRNGETVWEAEGVPPEDGWAASGLSQEEAREAGLLRDGAYSVGGTVEVECQPGDTLELFFTCRDAYGLRYTFPMESWKIDPDKAGDPHDGMAVTAPGFRPALSWD